MMKITLGDRGPAAWHERIACCDQAIHEETTIGRATARRSRRRFMVAGTSGSAGLVRVAAARSHSAARDPAAEDSSSVLHECSSAEPIPPIAGRSILAWLRLEDAEPMVQAIGGRRAAASWPTDTLIARAKPAMNRADSGSKATIEKSPSWNQPAARGNFAR